MKRDGNPRVIWSVALLLLVIGSNPKIVSAQPVSGIKVPPGFDVIQAAGDRLATDIYCLAVSPNGETFVSGPGYIKVLSDSDRDGVFDTVRQFSDRPASGAQGICFDGNDLLCTGDGGLWRFSDTDQDGFADANPQLLLPIKTGGEHDAHAIRKGPDGWWYLLAGNGTPILPEYFSGPSSPVTLPRAGFLMRISPDGSQREIYAHGFRNAYDFDFNSNGQVFVYDSDGERDISLPWYRPTRVFQMQPGDDAGWVAAGWKRPSDFFDMPKEIGDLGRGSPTGVVVGNSASFPAEYSDAIFVADWTFGRVMVFRKNPETGTYDSGSEFAVADGQFGFAVTDLDFATDGSLLVSTGGRGTQGAVYRVRYREDGAARAVPRMAVVPGESSAPRRVDAVRLANQLGNANPNETIDLLGALVGRRDVLANRASRSAPLQAALVRGLTDWLNKPDPIEMGVLFRVLEDLDLETLQALDRSEMPPSTRLMVASIGSPGSIDSIEQIAQALVAGEGDVLQIARVGQLSLGGCGRDDAEQMFQGYTAKIPTAFTPSARVSIADQLSLAMQKVNRRSNDSKQRDRELAEIGRLAAMLNAGSQQLYREIANQLSRPDASAQQDIHWLVCLAQIIGDSKTPLENEVESIVADGLIGVRAKIQRDQQDIDRNFYPRMTSLTKRLVARTSVEFALMVASRLAGDDADLFLCESLEGVARDAAVARFVKYAESNPESVTAGQLSVIASSPGEIYMPLVRSFSRRPDLQSILIATLHRSPLPVDRALFRSGLASSNPPTVKQAAIGLRRIFDTPHPSEIVAAYRAIRRLSWEKSTVSVRDQLVLLLRQETGQNFGYQQKMQMAIQDTAMDRWEAFVRKTYPVKFKSLVDTSNAVQLEQRMATVDWDSGDPDRGRKIYFDLQCAQCHDAGTRLGPRLEGVTTRFRPDDLFRAIVSPNDQVPQRYRAIVIETVDGQFYQGSMVYESVDGMTLQEVGGNTVRINRSDIETQSVSSKSLMPEGLLSDSSDQDWADLLAYLKRDKK